MFKKSSIALAGVLASVAGALAEPPDVPNYYDIIGNRPAVEGRNVAVPSAGSGPTIEEELLFKRAQGRDN